MADETYRSDEVELSRTSHHAERRSDVIASFTSLPSAILRTCIRRRTLLIACIITASGLSTAGLAQEFRFMDLARLDSMEIPTREETGVASVFSENERPLDDHLIDGQTETSGVGTPISLIAFDSEKLLTVGRITEPTFLIASPVVALTFSGQTYRMALVERIRDRKFDAFHLLFKSTSGTDYVRLSTRGQAVVGTLTLGADPYRLIALDDGDQLLYRVHPSHAPCPVPMHDASGDRRLEARHVQLACVANIQPTTFQTSADGRLEMISGGDLGKLADWIPPADVVGRPEAAIEGAMASSVSDYLSTMRSLFLVDEDIEVQIDAVAPSVGSGEVETIVYFRQRINRIPVDSTNILVVSYSGSVSSYSGDLYPAQMALPIRPDWIVGHAARQIASDWLISNLDESGTNGVGDASLSYKVHASGRLEPIWTVPVVTTAFSLSVELDAVTGRIANFHN